MGKKKITWFEIYCGEKATKLCGQASGAGDGVEELELVRVRAKQMPKHHLPAGRRHLRHCAAAAVGEDFFTQLLERHDTHATEAVKLGVARQFPLGLKRRLLRHDPINWRAQRIARSGIHDRPKAAMRLPRPGAADDKTNRH